MARKFMYTVKERYTTNGYTTGWSGVTYFGNRGRAEKEYMKRLRALIEKDYVYTGKESEEGSELFVVTNNFRSTIEGNDTTVELTWSNDYLL